MAARDVSGSGAATAKGGEFQDYTDRGLRGHGRARRGPPDPGRAGQRPGRAAGTARRASAARARPRSTASPADVHDAADDLPPDQPVTVEPMRAFPPIKDLVTDVSWNYEVKKRIKPFKPRPPDAPDGTWRMAQADVDRVQEFRKCIECFLCQDVCHVLRDHHKHEEFIGPRFLVHAAALEMHPLDIEDRLEELKAAHGIGYCNITKCCTKVCPRTSRSPTTRSSGPDHAAPGAHGRVRHGAARVARAQEEVVPRLKGRLRAGLLRRHHPRAREERSSRRASPGMGAMGRRRAAPGPWPLFEKARGTAPPGQRRRAAALERVRAPARAAARAWRSRRSRRYEAPLE